MFGSHNLLSFYKLFLWELGFTFVGNEAYKVWEKAGTIERVEIEFSKF